MNNSVAKQVAFIGVMFALVFVVLMLETYVFIYFIKPSPAFLSIPLAISLSVYADKKKMFLGGSILGICSWIIAFILAYTPFYNPIIPILPRILMGVIAFGVYHGIKKITKNSNNSFVREILPLSIAGGVGVLSNTIGVLGLMFLGENTFLETALGVILGVNFSLEFIMGIVLVPIIVKTLKKISTKKGYN